jgi:hypothetical protein
LGQKHPRAKNRRDAAAASCYREREEEEEEEEDVSDEGKTRYGR